MKKTRILILSSFVVLGATLAMEISLSKNGSLFFLSTAEAKVVTLNKTETPTIFDGVGILEEEFATYHYTGASSAEGYHVALSTGGTIFKDEATKGLTSVTATFTGALELHCGYGADYETQEVEYIADLTSETSLPVSGNYWKIVATEDTNIESITLNYSCDTESSGTIDDYVELIDLPTDLQFANLIEENDTTYCTIDCVYDNTKGRIKTSDLQIKGDAGAQVYECERIETTASDRFTAYFDVSSQHDSILNGQSKQIVYLHLFINNIGWNTTNGTNGNGNVAKTVDSSVVSKLLTRTITRDGNKAIEFGLRNTGTRLAWLIYTNNSIYDFNANFGNDPTAKENEGNPFAFVNGGTSSKTNYSYNTEYGAYYGGSGSNGVAGESFTMKIVANKDVNATFKLIGASSNGRKIGYANTNNVYISDMSMTNSDGAGTVTPLDVYTTATGNGGTSDWYNYLYCPVADLELKAGINELSFTVNGLNMNLAGVSLQLDDSTARVNLYHEYDINYSPSVMNNDNTYKYDVSQRITSVVPDGYFDPFYSANGGSIVGTPVSGFETMNYQWENNQHMRYGELNQYVMTINVYAREATEIEFSFLGSSNSSGNRHYSATQSVVSSYTNNAYISTLKLNNVDVDAANKSTEDISFTGWSNYLTLPVATLSLSKGVNTISFAYTAATTSAKINVRGVVIQSAVPVYLGVNH